MNADMKQAMERRVLARTKAELRVAANKHTFMQKKLQLRV